MLDCVPDNHYHNAVNHNCYKNNSEKNCTKANLAMYQSGSEVVVVSVRIGVVETVHGTGRVVAGMVGYSRNSQVA